MGKGNKRMMLVDYDSMKANLSAIREKSKLDAKSEFSKALWTYVTTKNYTYTSVNEDYFGTKFSPPVEIGNASTSTVNILKNEAGEPYISDRCPTILSDFVLRCVALSQLKLEDFKEVVFTFIPPARRVSHFKHVIPRGDLKTGKRYLMFLGSDEYLKYDSEGASTVTAGLIPGSSMAIQHQFDPVERSNLLKYDWVTQFGILTVYDDEEYYTINTKGVNERKKKLPLNRYTILIEFNFEKGLIKSRAIEQVKELADHSKKNNSKKVSEMKIKLLKSQLASQGIDIDTIDVETEESNVKPSADVQLDRATKLALNSIFDEMDDEAEDVHTEA